MASQLYDYWFVQFDFPDKNGKPYKSSGGKMVWCNKLKREIPQKQPVFAILLILAGVILNTVIVYLAPVNDGWYYLGDAVGILLLVIAAVSMMRVYNTGTTRPLPKLFDRNEV